MCKVTHCVQSYTLCVKLHTEYKSSFTLIVKKFPSLEIFYTTAGSDGSDFYQVCVEPSQVQYSASASASTLAGAPALDLAITSGGGHHCYFH